MLKALEVNKIDPSPFQTRKQFDRDKLKELAASIERDGQIEPIVARRNGRGRHEAIAGWRRIKAVRDFTKKKTILARVIKVDDLQARRISAAENLQREDLSAVETVEAIVEIVDAELIEDNEYASMGKKPTDRVKALLGKLHSRICSRRRGSKVSEETELLYSKFTIQVEKIFKNLPKSLEWRSFFLNDLPLLVDISDDVRRASIRNGLNRSQTKALQTLKAASVQEFHRVISNGKGRSSSDPVVMSGRKYSPHIDLKDLSSREIKDIAERAAKKEGQADFNRARISSSAGREMGAFIMGRLGIPVERIAARLRIDRKTAKKYVEDKCLIPSIKRSLKKGMACHKVAEKQGCPEPLVWSVALEGKTDQDRFKALNWGLRTWDHWFFNDVDQRFGDNWPGQIPAQLVAHTLFYFTREGDLVFDPMAGGGVVADTCLAFDRKCWSFDLADRLETRPEIEPYQWNPDNLTWPVNGNKKPALIFFDPPYFNKMAQQYEKESISTLTRKDYLKFFREIFPLFHDRSAANARIAFINSDWREFRGISAMEEDPEQNILLSDYIKLLERSGWEITHIIDCPMSSQRFKPNQVSRMQKNRILGVVRRSLIVGRKN